LLLQGENSICIFVRVKNIKGEIPRQVFHFVNGIIILFFYLNWGKVVGMILIFLSFFGLCLSLAHTKRPFRWAEPVLAILDREKDINRLPAKGAILYGFSVGFCLAIFSQTAAVASLTTLAAGDAASTLAGLAFGSHPIPWNKKLTLEGSFGFILGSFVFSAIFLPIPVALIASFFGAFLETVAWFVDDNICIPLGVGIVIQLIFY